MIIVRLKGGLGNQLFQYAFGRTLAEKYSTNLLLDTTWYEGEIAKQAGRIYQLDELTITANHASPAQLIVASKEISLKRKTLFGKLLWEKKSDGLQTGFDASYLKKRSRHLLVDGYWQSEKYFSPIAEKLRQGLTLKHGISADIQEVLKELKAVSSIAVHIRRGDYLNTGKNYHGVLSQDYYQKAAAFFEKHIPNPKYYIFSDDPEWCLSNIDFFSPKVIISTHDQQESWTSTQELILMAACQHHIIANSSFSWWGAWLSKNPIQQVIAPSKWFAGRENLPDLLPEKWIRIENDF